MKTRLVDDLVTALNLPLQHGEKEVHSLLQKYEKNPNDVTLDELRLIVADFLQDVFNDLLDQEITQKN